MTGIARTLLDLGDVIDAHQLANVLHEVAYRHHVDDRAIRALLRGSAGRSAVTVLARALDLHRSGSAGTRSRLEDRFLSLLRERGVQEPLVNVRVKVPGGELEVDFVWPSEGLCIEVDGPGHARQATAAQDRVREAKLREAGYGVIRTTHDGLEQCAEEALRLLSRRRAAARAARPRSWRR